MEKKPIRKAISRTIPYLEKGKRGVFRLVFGRTGIVCGMIFLQVLLMYFVYKNFVSHITYLYSGYMAIAVAIVVYIVNRPDNPTLKLSWCILILVFPFLGSFLYIMVKLQIGHRVIDRKLTNQIELSRPYAVSEYHTEIRLSLEDAGVSNLAQYVEDFGPYPIYRNNAVQYLPSGDALFEELMIRLRRARHFVFLEYFIIAEGYMWDTILALLTKKVKEGVEVYLLYDGTCSIGTLPPGYAKKMERLGIKCKVFSPVYPLVSTHYNNRDHRKILVIDGHTAFTGGINLADEYMNVKKRFGHWKDTAVMIQGPAVRSFSLMFLQIWNTTDPVLRYKTYLDVPVPEFLYENGYVMPYADSPLDAEQIGKMVYLDMINRAKRYVHITTPYLILDHEMVTALTYAAKRGVEVAIVMPHIPDKKPVFALSKTHYPELLAAGVRIFEYTPGFIHAKMVVCDDLEAVIGSINFDYRSLYLSFECAAYLYKCDAIAQMEKDIQEILCKSHQITRRDWEREKKFTKFAGSLMKLLAPLM